MFCGKCGTKIIEGDSFCTNCGARVVKPNETSEEEFDFSFHDNKTSVNVQDEENEWILSDAEGNKYDFGTSSEEAELNDNLKSKSKNMHNKTNDITSAKSVIEYDNNTDPNDMDYIIIKNNKKQIEWLVLEKKDDKALLISKTILYYTDFETRRYLHNGWGGDGETSSQVNWQGSDASLYLNKDFFNGFEDGFKDKVLLEVENKSYEAEDYKVFILSSDEYDRYFGKIDNENNKRIISRDNETGKISDIWCIGVDYDYDDHMDIITESYERTYITIDEKGISHMKKYCSGIRKGIRPAMWVKI